MMNRKQIIWTAVVVLLVAAAAVAAVFWHRQNTEVKQILAKQVASVSINLGNGKTATAYITPLSVRSQTVLDNCGTLQGKKIVFGNFQLSVVRQYNPLGLGRLVRMYKIYTYPLDNFSFGAVGTDNPVKGNLEKIHLDLSDYPADTIVVDQYENCSHFSSELFNINQKTGKLQPFESRTLSNQVGTRIVIANTTKFTAAGRDAMDTFVINPAPDPKHKLVRIHWKFNPAIAQFVETGKNPE